MSSSLPQAMYDQARQLHKAGQLAEAELLYEKVLSAQPNDAEAMQLLGMLAGQRGQASRSVELFRSAAGLQPSSPTVWFNLGGALLAAKILSDAAEAFRRAGLLRPDYAAAHNNLGICLSQLGDHEAAVAAFERAVKYRPEHAASWCNLGDALQKLSRWSEAVSAYQRAIALQPDYANARNHLGNALMELDDADSAEREYTNASQLEPARGEFVRNLGNALRSQGRLADAIGAYRRSIALSPDDAEAHYNLANVLKESGELDNAIASYHRALTLNPAYTEAHYNLGNALKDTGQIAAAISQYRKAIELSPQRSEPWDNLVYAMLFDPEATPSQIADELGKWDRIHARPLFPAMRDFANDRQPDRQLRIGYVGADFRDHCQAFFLWPLLNSHDAASVEIFVYSNVSKPDARTEQFRKLIPNWRDVRRLSDEQLAGQIRDDRIDILIDLTLHMADHRLLAFARKPAPVQISWLGYPASSGLSAMDYRLSDPWLDPIDGDDRLTPENILRLPDCFWCYDPLECRDLPISPLPSDSLGSITFGCLSNYCKVNGETIDLWASVLKMVPGSRLLLLAPIGSPRRRTIEHLASKGVDPNRVEFVPFQLRKAYMETYHRIDIALETIPYNGHTTSLDAMWMGVPVITLAGSSAVGRAGISQLRQVGLRDLVAQRREDVAIIAAELAADTRRLRELRQSLRAKMLGSPLMDAPRFARNIEAVYRHAWRNWCAG